MADIKMGYSLENDKSRLTSTNILSDKFLRINQCGMLQTEDTDFNVDRPIRKDYMLIYISMGSADVWFNNKRIQATNGDILLFKPGTPLKYHFHSYSRHYYIHFSGSSVQTLLSECALYYSGKYTIGKFNELISAIPKICIELQQRSIYTEYKCNGLFISLLGQISAKITNVDISNFSNYERLSPAINAMIAEFHINHPLSYYAKLCNMSVSYFKHSFVQYTSITPLNYIISLRLDSAIMMMQDNKKSVKEISYAVGYNDPLYFGRIFKKFFGVTPTEYIKHQQPTEQKS